MKLEEAQEKFINSWGSLGSQWGINRTMAQIHALFLITDKPLSAEDIMQKLKISRGNTNMNVRTLIDWGLVFKETFAGDRKEYFIGEKDIWTITRRVIKVRKERELTPMLRVLASIKDVRDDDNKDAVIAFAAKMKDIEKVASKSSAILDKVVGAEEKWFWTILSKML